MRMLGSGINPKVGHHLTAQAIARQHAFDRLRHQTLGKLPFQDLTSAALLDPAGVPGVPIVQLVGAFLARQLNLVGVDDDHVVAHIHVRRETGFVFTAQARGNDRGKTAQNNAFGVDQDPFLVDICWCRREGFHVETPGIPKVTVDRDLRGSPRRGDGRVIKPPQTQSSGIDRKTYLQINGLRIWYYNTPHSRPILPPPAPLHLARNIPGGAGAGPRSCLKT